MLVVAGARVGDSRADDSQDWPDASAPPADRRTSYGGPTDTWGLSLTDVEINDPSFGFAYSPIRSGGGAVDAFVGHIWIEVFADDPGTDCDDTDATRWGVSPLWVDVDGDYYTVGMSTDVCYCYDTVGTTVATTPTEACGTSAPRDYCFVAVCGAGCAPFSSPVTVRCR